MMKLFLELSDHLMCSVSDLAFVDLDSGQLDGFSEASEVVSTPCVLLKISAPNIEEVDQGTDMLPVQIVARVVVDKTAGETSSVTPSQWRQKSLDRLEVVDDVTKALRGYYSARLTPLVRTGSTPEGRRGSLYVHAVTFTGTYTEEFE